jgi:hypothetical protein
MKKLIFISTCLTALLALAAPGPQTISNLAWSDPSRAPTPTGATVVTNSGRVCLRIENAEAKEAKFPLWTVPKPAISNTLYAVKGEIQYENVAGDGYLEMWNQLPGGQYFSRTLAATGPLSKISGSSGWRAFVLPFDRGDVSNTVQNLEINLCLNGQGTVLLGPLQLVEYAPGTAITEVLAEGSGLKAATVTVDGRTCFKVEGAQTGPTQASLTTIEKPAVTGHIYKVSGEIKYEGVEGDGYLEMWNVYPSGRSFSRTLAPTGPLGKITGSSGWRPFVLPFDRTGTTELPTRLEINAFLPGRGTLYVGPMTFTDCPKATSVEEAVYPGGWWSILTGLGIGFAGIALAVVFGLGLVLLARGGKARGLVIPITAALSLLGIGAALACVASLAAGQPGYVWGALGFFGVVLLAVFPLLFNRLRRRYAEFELRRMTSMDAQGA